MESIDLDSDLLNYIAYTDIQPGSRLPSIQELTGEAYLGISTSKVREQLEVARALGLVEVRSKTGTRRKEYSFAPAARLSVLFSLASEEASFEMLSSLRTHIEIGYWHEACSLLTEEDQAIMRDCIENARLKLNAPPIHIPNTEHRLFHLTMFQRLDNLFVQGILEAYWDIYDTVMVNRYNDYEYLQKVWNYHELILDALIEKNFDRAQTAFMDHIRLLRFQPPTEAAYKTE